MRLIPVLMALTVTAASQFAQAQNLNWRGSIAGYDGKSLTVLLRDGTQVVVALPEALPVAVTQRFSMQEVRPGMLLGVTTVGRADGAPGLTSASGIALVYAMLGRFAGLAR